MHSYYKICNELPRLYRFGFSEDFFRSAQEPDSVLVLDYHSILISFICIMLLTVAIVLQIY